LSFFEEENDQEGESSFDDKFVIKNRIAFDDKFVIKNRIALTPPGVF
jgi:hypothetical protein